ncbi:MAG: ATP-binding protein [Chloroflexi bacterium]|nr:ATP-binding protein [Chloroflexota bacterium]
MGKVRIEANLGNLLAYIGSLYRNPAEAAKEYISNAIDTWKKAGGDVSRPCHVVFQLSRSRIVVDYDAPGMTQDEFKAALRRVADSIKKGEPSAIGELGIGLFAFSQFANCATFFSKKDKHGPTLKVVLRKGSAEAEIATAMKRETRPERGMTIVFTGLFTDPLRRRGPLSAEVLQRFFSEKFDPYLREGGLQISVAANGERLEVLPLNIDLPKVGVAFGQVHLTGEWQKSFGCQFWFDPSGNGRVLIRHKGLAIVEDLKDLQAYGLQESILASGFVRGDINADFLKPLPARAGFELNRDWILFLKELERICPSIEAEVEQLKAEVEQKSLTTIQKQAIEMAKSILSQETFKDLALLGGLVRKRGPKKLTGKSSKKGQLTGERSGDPGAKRGPGLRIKYQELPFEQEASLHSRFISGIVQVNTLNADYLREMKGTPKDQLAYCTLMIGKETLTYNNKEADRVLEKLLSYLFQIKSKVGTWRPAARPKKSKRLVARSPQMKLNLR